MLMMLAQMEEECLVKGTTGVGTRVGRSLPQGARTWSLPRARAHESFAVTGGFRREHEYKGTAWKVWEMLCRRPFEVLIGQLLHFQ